MPHQPNRLAVAIATVQARLDSQGFDAHKLADLDATLALEPDEHFHYQQLQAEMHAGGKLTVDEALLIYTALGETYTEHNGGWTADTTLATKYVVTQVIGELIKSRMGVSR